MSSAESSHGAQRSSPQHTVPPPPTTPRPNTAKLDQINQQSSLQLQCKSLSIKGLTSVTSELVRQQPSNIRSTTKLHGSPENSQGLNREHSLPTDILTALQEECGDKPSTSRSTKPKTVNHATSEIIKPQDCNEVSQSIQVSELKSHPKVSVVKKSGSYSKKDCDCSTYPSKSKRLYDKFPSLGPLNITNLDNFLERSKIEFEIMYRENIKYDCNLSHFKLLKTLGRGSFGKVLLAQLIEDDKMRFAIKIMSKQEVVKRQQVVYVISEKRILQALNFPFTIFLKYFFSDAHYLYFVLPYVSGGDLDHYLIKYKPIQESCAQFFVGQLVLALEYLHYIGLIHRDIKPVNIIVDGRSYLKVADFGQCIRVVPKDKTWTMTGTPEYMAPEIILGRGYDCSVDWWALGVVTFEMCSGFQPFKSDTVERVYKLVLKGKYYFPDHFSSKLKTFINKLLESTPSRRISKDPSGKASKIKSLLWLKDTDWIALLNRTVVPPTHLPLALKGQTLEHVSTSTVQVNKLK